MKPSGITKSLALVGWVLWPALFALVFVSSRVATQLSMETWATYAGQLQAKVWFQEDKARLLELSPNPKTEFTGRKDGQFEVWTWTHDTNSSWLVPGDADHTFVEAFNKRMKQLSDEKPKSGK